MDVHVTDLGDSLYLVDALMFNERERLACYVFDTPERLVIECGPSKTIDHLFAALDHAGIDDVAVMAVTHIHLDHAGGAWRFAQRFPNARIGVHSKGARHLTSPQRLWDSATRIYGEADMRSLWGRMEPIPADRLLILDEGDHIPLGNARSVEAMYTPGHAKHHIVYHESTTGAAFVGDAVGLAYPHGHMVQPVAPPPDFDADLVVEQLHRIAEREPSFLGFAHYGPDKDPQASLAQAESRLRSWVAWIEASPLDGEALAAALREWVLDDYRHQGYPEADIATYDANAHWPSHTAGIRRWLSQRSS